MSRTIKEMRIDSKPPDEIKHGLIDWLVKNNFKIIEQNSDGKSFNYRRWWSWFGVKVSPCKGSIVAIKYDFTGCIIFEIILIKDVDGTLFHGEFYAAGAEIYRNREWDLNTESGILGMLPRKEGYKAMSYLLRTLE